MHFKQVILMSKENKQNKERVWFPDYSIKL